MEKILMYITNHYIYFVIAGIVLIISAVGYVVDNKQQELKKAKEIPDADKPKPVTKEEKAKKK